MDQLTFKRLREQNAMRCVSMFHPIGDWSPTDWGCAMAGEAGEACNLIKKLRRLDGADWDIDTPEERERLRKAIALEIADVVIYADLLAERLGIDLAHAVTTKFNKVSHERGSSLFLP